jgi:hypothetical protein
MDWRKCSAHLINPYNFESVSVTRHRTKSLLADNVTPLIAASS